MAWYNWSHTADSNGTADPSINFAEGQSPPSLNDSARALMAASAKFRDDIGGAIVTTGSGAAYVVASNSVFSALGSINGPIAFTPHTTNTGAATLNLDGLGAKPLRTSTGVDLMAGMLIGGTPYVVTYNASAQVYYLHSFYGNPYNIPLGGYLLSSTAVTPNSAFVQPYGQAISRTTYAAYFALVSTTYGAGDSSSTFNVPDLRGRFPGFLDAMGGVAANRITSGAGGVDGGTLGAVGGSQTHTLLTAELPTITPSVSSASVNLASGTAATTSSVSASAIAAALSAASTATPTVSFPARNWNTGGGGTSDTTHVSLGSNLGSDAGTFNATISVPVTTSLSGSGTVSVASSTALSGTLTPSITLNSIGSGSAHSIVPPVIMMNAFVRVL